MLGEELKKKQQNKVEQLNGDRVKDKMARKLKIRYTKVCKSEWDTAPKGYKSVIKGRKYLLMRTDKGASLVPIKFKKSKC